MLIHNLLETSAHLYPDKLALVHEDQRVSYGRVNAEANELAHWLIEQGVNPGDRIGLLAQNSLEYVVAYYGSLKTGAVIAPLSDELKPDGLRYLLGQLEPKVVISTKKFERLLINADVGGFNIAKMVLKSPQRGWAGSGLDVHSWSDIVTDAQHAPNPDLPIDPTALASIIFTSGSTGKPKGVMLSHRNIVANTQSICEYLELTRDDIQMVVLPFYYVMGKSLLNTHVAVGGTVVINNKFAFPAGVIRQMVDECVTGFSGVPSTFAFLLHRSPLAQYRENLTALRYCSQAGGHMARKLKEELRQVLPPHTKIFIMYGATEAAARLTYLEPERFEKKIESIGKGIPGVIVRVLDPSGHEVSPGEIGELVASGENIMQGYWKDGDATKRAIDGNGYHTGDLGYKDDEGFLYIVGRKDNLLKVGGHRINTQEVEDVLIETGLVSEVAVLGIPDALMGNKLVALVVAKSAREFDESKVMAHCVGRMARYKLPAKIQLVKTLPKYSSGKIDRAQCLKILKK